MADRTNSILAIFIIIFFIVGGYVLNFYLHYRSRVTLTFESPHGEVAIYMDGNKMGVTPISVKQVQLGFRKFRFEKEGFAPKEWIYDCKPAIDYSGEIFLSDLSLTSTQLVTKANQFSAPAVYEKGYYYIAGLDGQIGRFDDNLQLVWSIDLDKTVVNQLLFSNDLIIVGSFEGSLFAVYKNTGQISWQVDLTGNAVPLMVENSSIWVYANGDLYNFDLTGQVLSTDSFSETLIEETFSLIKGKPTIMSDRGTLYSYDSGSWTAETYKVRGLVKNCIIKKEQIYILTSLGYLYCYNLDGSPVFIDSRFDKLPVDMIYHQDYLIISAAKTFYILNPVNGEVIFTRQLIEKINGIDAHDDKLIIRGYSRFTYFFKTNGEFITSKDYQSSIYQVTYIPQITSYLVTARGGVYLSQLP